MSNDPGEVKKEIRAIARAAEKELQNTFEVAAREWFAACSPALTPRHAAKLQRYRETILFPSLDNKSVTNLDSVVTRLFKVVFTVWFVRFQP